jgi:hypothetical protein
MGRPKISESKKRATVSISLSPEILALAERSENKSIFFERCVGIASGLAEIMEAIRDKKIKTSEAMQDLEDFAAIFERSFEESVPAEAIKPRSLRKTGT